MRVGKWSRDKQIDLNTTRFEHHIEDQLQTLPGLNEAEAGRVIAGRRLL